MVGGGRVDFTTTTTSVLLEHILPNHIAGAGGRVVVGVRPGGMGRLLLLLRVRLVWAATGEDVVGTVKLGDNEHFLMVTGVAGTVTSFVTCAVTGHITGTVRHPAGTPPGLLPHSPRSPPPGPEPPRTLPTLHKRLAKLRSMCPARGLKWLLGEAGTS